MKTKPLAILALYCVTGLSLFGKVPDSVTQLGEQRNAAIQTIDEKYVKELEKIKISVTKTGDLESALAVDSLIKNVQNQTIGHKNIRPLADANSEATVLGEWLYTYLSNGYHETWTFRGDGKLEFSPADKSGSKSGNWSVKGDNLVVEKSGHIFRFPMDTLVSPKIETDKGVATIKKIK